MTSGREFVDFAVELLGPFGTVAPRPMFGGHGIYLDDLMFAIVHDEVLWFKTDEMNRSQFEAVGSEPFTYARNGKTTTMGFYRAPAESLDSPAAALPWARSAYAAALRARGTKPDRPIELALAPFSPTPKRAPRSPAPRKPASAGADSVRSDVSRKIVRKVLARARTAR